MNTTEALDALRELRAARPLIGPYEAAERASMILDRSTLRPLDLTEYLQKDRGLTGYALASMMGRFAPHVARLYQAKHGVAPLKRLQLVPGVGARPVNAYIEDDRELFDRAWRELSGDWDALGSKLDEIVGAQLLDDADERALLGDDVRIG